MAYSILNFVEADSSGTNVTTIDAPNFTVTAGSALVLFMWNQDGGSITKTPSDTVGSNDSWTQIGTEQASGTSRMNAFYLLNAASGSCTVRVTSSDVMDYPCIAVVELSGIATSSALAGNAANSQATPGTGSNLVTSGNTGTLTNQPAAFIAMTQNTNSGATPAAGTSPISFTSGDSYRAWDYGATFGARMEHARLTATTAVAATFTAGEDTLHQTIAVALLEAAGAPAGITKQAAAYYRMMRNR
jgi:hypothetical protein